MIISNIWKILIENSYCMIKFTNFVIGQFRTGKENLTAAFMLNQINWNCAFCLSFSFWTHLNIYFISLDIQLIAKWCEQYINVIPLNVSIIICGTKIDDHSIRKIIIIDLMNNENVLEYFGLCRTKKNNHNIDTIEDE